VHAELKTASKMFCDCKNDPEEKRPNTNVCPICLAHPGTLPVPNQKAIEAILKVGMALGGRLADKSKFDRKNYFYPDLPKGYQISQYDQPFVSGGKLRDIALTRVHLEEDTGRNQHPAADPKKTSYSLVDFNRAGVPLMELVTEPVIHDSATALRFARELQLILRYLGVSHADMEKGQMRVEANISVSSDPNKFGTKVEVKNLNSFRAVEGAIAYEIERQSKRLEEGERVVQETRGWNENTEETFSQRLKEEAHDYRYFPEPDIPPFDLERLDLQKIKEEIPELPDQKRVRFSNEYGFTPEKTEILVQDQPLAAYFEKAYSELLAFIKGEPDGAAELLYNYLVSDVKGLMNVMGVSFSDLKFKPEDFAHLVYFAKTNKVSSRAAKDILKKMFETGLDPEDILKNEGLEQVSDTSELLKTVLQIIEANPGPVAEYRKGKTNVLQFLVGRAMGTLKGKGNPTVLADLFKQNL
jgi:aspartyl-tRNA(Asn)/glutamyl-tRNA(Gln) amidotransferase subunit B